MYTYRENYYTVISLHTRAEELQMHTNVYQRYRQERSFAHTHTHTRVQQYDTHTYPHTRQQHSRNTYANIERTIDL